MGLVILRHGEDGDHGDGSFLAHLAAGTLVHGSQVGVQVAGVAAAAGDFLLSRRNLTQSLGVVGNVGENDQHVHVLLKGQILRGGQGHTGGGDTLDGRVVGQVGEQNGTVNGAGALKLADEELRLLEGDTDGSEDHGEVGLAVQHLGLTGDLSSQCGVGQTGTGEDGQLLTTNQSVQAVNGGDARLDKLVGVVPGGGVHGQTVDIPVLIGQDGRSAVNGLAHAVEHAAQHITGHGQLEGMAQEANLGLSQVDTGGVFKQLHHGGVAVYLQHLTATDSTVSQLDLGQLVIGDTLDVVDHHQRAGDLLDGFIFPNHRAISPFSPMALVSSSSSTIMLA